VGGDPASALARESDPDNRGCQQAKARAEGLRHVIVDRAPRGVRILEDERLRRDGGAS
jgi:hypothetical protein